MIASESTNRDSRRNSIANIMLFFVLLFLFCSCKSDPLPNLKIVHLGDSYSSGVGGRNSRGFRKYEGVSECYRSPHGWGHMYANYLRTSYNVTYINRACIGADSVHLIDYHLVDKKLLRRCPWKRRWKDDEFYNRTRFKLYCNKYVRPQVEAVDNSTDLVILTIGGNDMGFSDIVVRCVLGLGIREANKCIRALDEAREIQPNVTETVKTAVLDMWSRMGERGKIVLFQYPHVVGDHPRLWRDLGLKIDGPSLVRNFTIEGNAIYSTAADDLNEEMGVDIVEVFNETMELFAGHEPDPRRLSRNPYRWLYEFENPVLGAEDPFHPNPEGHRNWALAAAGRGVFGWEP